MRSYMYTELSVHKEKDRKLDPFLESNWDPD